MNKQVNYIVSAHLILAVAFGAIFIINKVPSTSTKEEQPIYPGTTMPQEKALNETELLGKNLFETNCAPCHKMGACNSYLGQAGTEQPGPWGDRQEFYSWIRNPKKMTEERVLKTGYRRGTMMPAFPELTIKEIDAIREYLN